MKKLFLILVLLSLVSCSSNEQFVLAVHDGLETMVPDLCRYIEADAKLTSQDKEIRTRAASELLQMVREEKARLEGNGGK